LKQPKIILLMPHGLTAAFDSHGEQIPELQVGWLALYLNFLEQQGIDPTTVRIELGSRPVKVFKTEDGYNYSLN